MSCTDLTRADTAARVAPPEVGTLLPPPNFPAGGFGDTPRRPLPAPTRAVLTREAAETPPGPGPARDRALPDHPDRASPTRVAVSPGGRGAPLSLIHSTGARVAPVPRGGAADPLPGRAANAPARIGKLILAEIAPEPSRLAQDLAALVAIALATAAIVVWLDALAGVPGGV